MAAFSTGCWGTLMDLVCYWGRHVVLHPYPYRHCVCVYLCVFVLKAKNPPCHISFSVLWNGDIGLVSVQKDPAHLREFDAFDVIITSASFHTSSSAHFYLNIAITSHMLSLIFYNPFSCFTQNRNVTLFFIMSTKKKNSYKQFSWFINE